MNNSSENISNEKPSKTLSITDAISEAESILNAARTEAEQLKLAGFNEGLEAGKKEAANTAIKKIQDVKELNILLEKASGELAYEIVKKIFSSEYLNLLDPICEIAKNIIGNGSGARSITIITNTGNRNRLNNLEEYIKNLGRLTYDIQESEQIKENTIIIKNDFGEIEVDLNYMLEELNQHLHLNTTLLKNG